MKRWIAAAPLLVLAGLAVLFATFGLHHDPHWIPDAMVGKPAPAEALPRLDDGQVVALKPLAKGPTIVAFFASWCGPCAEDAPALAALRLQGARIIGVAYKDEPAKTREFLNRYGDPFETVLVDRQGRAGVDYGVDAPPDTFLVGADDLILLKRAGPMQPIDVQVMLERTQGGGQATRP